MARLIICTAVVILLAAALRRLHLIDIKRGGKLSRSMSCLLLAGYTLGNLSLTILLRLAASLFSRAIPSDLEPEYQPDPMAPIVVGRPGSDWRAMKQGVGGLRRVWIYLNDPNTAIYYWFSCMLNVLLYMPLGMLLPVAVGRKAMGQKPMGRKGILLTAFLLSAGTELVQLVTGAGNCDLMDLICNLLGAWAGYEIWQRYITAESDQETHHRK